MARDEVAKRAYMRDYARQNRERYYALDATRRAIMAKYVREIKASSSCVDCNRSFPDYPEVLEFDHIGTDKVAAVARLVSQGCGKEKIDNEISKCELVCANCHRIRTINRNSRAREMVSRNAHNVETGGFDSPARYIVARESVE